MIITWTTKHEINFDPKIAFDSFWYGRHIEDFISGDDNADLDMIIEEIVHDDLAALDDEEYYSLTIEVVEKCEALVRKTYTDKIKQLMANAEQP